MHSATGADTRTRLLDAAAEVFAEQGYRHAKVRDICMRANANVAAVNYYFRDKEQLYMAVVDYAIDLAFQQAPHLHLDPAQPPAERLRLFVQTFIHNIFDKGQPAWYGKIIANESNDPTPALDVVVDKMVRPIMDGLSAVVADLLGPHATAETVDLCASSIISQCVMYHNAREIIRRLDPHEKYDQSALDRMANHIIGFSLAGLRTYMDNDTNRAPDTAAGREEI